MPELHRDGQAGDEFHEPVVEQRHARLHRGGHAHLVHLREDVVREPGVHVESHQAVDDLGAGGDGVSQIRSEHGLGRPGTDGLPEPGGQEIGLERGVESRDPVHMASGVVALRQDVVERRSVAAGDGGDAAEGQEHAVAHPGRQETLQQLRSGEPCVPWIAAE